MLLSSIMEFKKLKQTKEWQVWYNLSKKEGFEFEKQVAFRKLEQTQEWQNCYKSTLIIE